MDFILYLLLSIITGFLFSILINLVSIIINKKLININNFILPFDFKNGLLFSLIYCFNLINYTNFKYINYLLSSLIVATIFFGANYIINLINKTKFNIYKNYQNILKIQQKWIIYLIFAIFYSISIFIFSFFIFDYYNNFFVDLFNQNSVALITIILIIFIVLSFECICGIIFNIKCKNAIKNEKIILDIISFKRFLSDDKYFVNYKIKITKELIINYKNSNYYDYLMRQSDFHYFLKRK